jgi:hypothetical protein
MGQTANSVLAGWSTFYEIAGSAAGALTGLQFVVITLISQTKAIGSMREIRAFGTPTVVHFCMALLISATMSAPWQRLPDLAICMGAYGAAGILYSLRVLFHAHKADYSPDAEDWLWYTAIPMVAYGALIAAAILFSAHPTWALAIIAVTDFVFLFAGIHNAWDTVTYVALQQASKKTD